MNAIKIIARRFYHDYLLPPRFGEYERILSVARENGYSFETISSFDEVISKGNQAHGECPVSPVGEPTGPACLLGAAPVFCDITPDTYNLCSESLERQIKAVLAEGKLTPKLVVAVDFLGNPAGFAAIAAVCGKYGLPLLEDAAQGFGASYRGKRGCSFGDIAATSFFPAKPLGCYGDGGAVFTDDDEMDVLLRSYCVHGKGPGGKYDNVRVGLNSRLDNLQAAVLLPKLKALGDYEMDVLQAAAGRYGAAFAGKFVTPFVAEGCVSSWAQYALLAENQEQRDGVLAHLTEKGIPNMIYYPTPQHALPVFRGAPSYGEAFSNAAAYCARTFSLPMHPYLTEAEQETVISGGIGGSVKGRAENHGNVRHHEKEWLRT